MLVLVGQIQNHEALSRDVEDMNPDEVVEHPACRRVLNALAAIVLIFAALKIARTHQLPLLIPAVLPMSLYQMSSVSSDALIIGFSVLFVALCIRFLDIDGRFIRISLTLSLCLLTLAKPVHLPAGLLLLAAYKRLGWRRAIAFCGAAMAVAGGAYLWWSYLVRPFFRDGLIRYSRQSSGRAD